MSTVINGHNLSQVLTSTGLVPNQNLIDKVIDISRKLETKLKDLVNSPKFKKFKLTVAIEIAYKLVNRGNPSALSINRERLFSATKVSPTAPQISGTSREFIVPETYRQFLSICQNFLNVSDSNETDTNDASTSVSSSKPSPLEVLSMRYDGLNLLGMLKDRCQEYLTNYKEVFYNSLPEARKKDYDFDKPLYDCACFFVIAQENKVSSSFCPLLIKLMSSFSRFQSKKTSSWT